MTRGMLRATLSMAGLLVSLASQGSTAVTARVLSFGTYGNGNVYVALDQSIDEAGCTRSGFELAADSAAAKAVLATAALAVAAGTTVTIQTDGCLNGAPSFTGARAAYFIANSQS